MEGTARKEYIKAHKAKHKGLKVVLCGLFASNIYPHIGVSPDGLIQVNRDKVSIFIS